MRPPGAPRPCHRQEGPVPAGRPPPPRCWSPDVDVAEDVLLAGPGQEGDEASPGGGPRAEPFVEIMLDAFTELPFAVGQPCQEGDRHGEALLGPLVGAVGDQRRGGVAGPQVVKEAPPEEPFE